MATWDCALGEEIDDAPEAAVPLAARQELLWERVKLIRTAYEVGGADTPSGRVQTDAASIVKINGMVTAALAAQIGGAAFAMQFALADNSVVDLDAPAAITLGMAVAAHVAGVYSHSFTLRSTIEAAADVAALAAIDLDGGWPA